MNLLSLNFNITQKRFIYVIYVKVIHYLVVYNYAKVITIKSSQFQASRKNENWSKINPRARILSMASNV